MSLQKKFKKIKPHPTNEYKTVTIIISFFLIVFFTSKMWLPDADKVESTLVGTTQHSSSVTDLTLMSWEYNPSLNFMEVIIEVRDDKNFNRSEFASVAKISENKTIPSEIIIKENSMMVIHISKVPRNFKIISLWIEQLNNDKSNAQQYNKVNYKCDYRQVNINNDLKAKTKSQYILQSIENEISVVKNKIENINKIISDYQNQIKINESDIDILKKDMKYQTQDEIKNTDTVIANKLQDNVSLTMKIETEKKNISSLNEKLSKLNLKFSDAKKQERN